MTDHLAVLEELKKKWRKSAEVLETSEYPADADLLRQCADELEAAIALMRGQSEPVEVEAVAVVRRDRFNSAAYFDWLIEGGIDGLEQGAWLAVLPLPLPEHGSITLYKDSADE